jgi:hypothetical protein
MRLRYSGLIGLIWLVLLAGCGGQVATSGPVASTTPSLSPPLSSAPPLEIPPDALAVYQRSGCFDGVRDVLTVYSDGRLELVDRLGVTTNGSASAQALSAVQAQIQAAAGAVVPGAFVPPDACVYTISARLADGTTLAATTNDAARQSDPNSPIFATIDALENLRQQIR